MQEVLTSEPPSPGVHALWPPSSAASPALSLLLQPPSPLQSSPSLAPCAQPQSLSATGQSCCVRQQDLMHSDTCNEPSAKDLQRQRMWAKC